MIDHVAEPNRLSAAGRDYMLLSEEARSRLSSGEPQDESAVRSPTSALSADANHRDDIRLGDVTSTPLQNVIWIASYPKSGNTWVRVFLHNLAREMRGETEGEQDINALGRFATQERGRYFSEVLGKPHHEASAAETARARPLVQGLIAQRHSGATFAKTHLCFGLDHGYPTIELNVTRAAIYIVRNPLDVAISYAHHCGGSIDAMIAKMAVSGLHFAGSKNCVAETIGSWSQHVDSWLGVKSRPVYVIRYEDMLAQPLALFGRLAHYLGLTPTDHQLQAAVEKSSFDALARQERKNGFAERPQQAARFFREGRAGQWRTVLSQVQVDTIISQHHSTMTRLGYGDVTATMKRSEERIS